MINYLKRESGSYAALFLYKGVWKEMASISKSGATWRYRVSHMVDGERKVISKRGFKTKKEAQVAAISVEAELNKGQQVIVKDKSLAQLFDDWIKLYKEPKAINTYIRYENTSKRLKEYFKDMPIQKVTRPIYQKFLNDYGEGKSRETVRKLNTHLKGFIKDMIEDGYVTIDFTRKVDINSTYQAMRSEDKHLNYLESQKLYNYLISNLSSTTFTNHLILLGLVSGLRFGEIVGLTTSSFDFKENMISVTKAWDYKRGSGFTDLKNTSSERKISIDSKVMSIFKKYILSIPANQYDMVFYKETANKTISNEGVNKALRIILENLSISRITTHGLRHTHASVLLFKGANVHSVSQRLGHADIQTTLDHYAHVLEEMKERDESIAVNIYNSY